MDKFACITLLALCAIAYSQATEVKTSFALRDLRRDLFKDYDKKVRPVKNPSTQIPLNVSISPLSIKLLDTREQVIVMDTWMLSTWQDEFLQWDPKDYGDVTELRLPAEDVWLPDLALYTATPDTALFPKIQTNVIAYSTGKVLWVPPFTLRSNCPRSSKNDLPDQNIVTCNMKIGSWTFSGPLLDLQLASNEVDLSDFSDHNPDWKLVKAEANREGKFYPCCPEEYPLIHFNVTLKRRSSSLWKV